MRSWLGWDSIILLLRAAQPDAPAPSVDAVASPGVHTAGHTGARASVDPAVIVVDGLVHQAAHGVEVATADASQALLQLWSLTPRLGSKHLQGQLGMTAITRLSLVARCFQELSKPRWEVRPWLLHLLPPPSISLYLWACS